MDVVPFLVFVIVVMAAGYIGIALDKVFQIQKEKKYADVRTFDEYLRS